MDFFSSFRRSCSPNFTPKMSVRVIKSFLRGMSSKRSVFIVDLDSSENKLLCQEYSSNEALSRIAILRELVKVNRTKDVFLATKSLCLSNQEYFNMLASKLSIPVEETKTESGIFEGLLFGEVLLENQIVRSSLQVSYMKKTIIVYVEYIR
jgi:hypothetical protein